MAKTKRWYFKFPTEFYALGPIEADSEAAVRQWVREFTGLKRLPAGFECWITNDCTNHPSLQNHALKTRNPASEPRLQP